MSVMVAKQLTVLGKLSSSPPSWVRLILFLGHLRPQASEGCLVLERGPKSQGWEEQVSSWGAGVKPQGFLHQRLTANIVYF